MSKAGGDNHPPAASLEAERVKREEAERLRRYRRRLKEAGITELRARILAEKRQTAEQLLQPFEDEAAHRLKDMK